MLFSIDATPFGATPNSVAVDDGVIAIAVEAEIKTDPGTVAFFDAGGNLLSQVKVGALPDMLTFTPNGRKVLVANEGEPSDDYTIDPEGSVSIIDLKGGVASVAQDDAVTARFTAFNSAGSIRASAFSVLAPASRRISNPNSSPYPRIRKPRGSCFRRTTRWPSSTSKKANSKS